MTTVAEWVQAQIAAGETTAEDAQATAVAVADRDARRKFKQWTFKSAKELPDGRVEIRCTPPSDPTVATIVIDIRPGAARRCSSVTIDRTGQS
jgi:hypothetical protein